MINVIIREKGQNTPSILTIYEEIPDLNKLHVGRIEKDNYQTRFSNHLCAVVFTWIKG